VSIRGAIGPEADRLGGVPLQWRAAAARASPSGRSAAACERRFREQTHAGTAHRAKHAADPVDNSPSPRVDDL